MEPNIKLKYEFYDPETATRRLAELILFISKRAKDHKYLGKKKLNKILFFSDFLAYLRFGVSISGARYIRKQYGPMPERVELALDRLKRNGELVFQHHLLITKFEERPINVREPKLKDFNAEEITLVDGIINMFKNKSGKDASDLSHLLRLWRIYPNGASIPYQAAFISNEGISEKDRQILGELRVAHGW